ncbi:histidine kinase [Tychonema sp. LEGE 07199]|uniref:sensor histidine kinase n=1 Tax=unclassified Tychonema TaxID=2642144 RepID=UPI001882B0AB|nr:MULTISPECIES: ATP-binding protein [unclassified Tychonema]MBE9123206.1 histidine kinase [Tychonema sp. LEGE 07199]MBE9134879.1 histidine kinase [Tychonema sp. LEGE 07196]
MVPPAFSSPPLIFAKAFPFHLAFRRRETEIIHLGDVLARICPELSLGSSLKEHFRIERPKISVEFDVIREKSDSMFLIEYLHSKILLKGQMVPAENPEIIFFLGSPWIEDLADLTPLGLTINDFALHDRVVDLLLLLQGQKTALADAKKLTDKLTKQRAQLRLALQEAEQAANAMAQTQQLKKTLQELQQTQAQLIQSAKMSSLGELVAGVAHEINNPINFIVGNLDYASDRIQELLQLIKLYQKYNPDPAPEIEAYADEIELDFLDEDLPKLCSSMRVGGDRIHNIVLSLRNFSRLDEAEMKFVDIHEGLDSTLLILQHRLKANNGRSEIEVIKEYGPLPLIECYPGQLNQVFVNLLGNAVDALESQKQEGGQIRIRTELLPADDRARVLISDNGPGFSKEVGDRMFDPFFTTKPVGQGTGLGLSISYQIIVLKHQGLIRPVGVPGEGAEFCIEIPLKQKIMAGGI